MARLLLGALISAWVLVGCGTAPEPTPARAPVPTFTATPAPPAPTPTPDPDLVAPGVHLVGVDIQPGLYRGDGSGSAFGCYWARLSDLSGQLSGIVANANAPGQFYIQVLPTDMAVEVKCPMRRVESLEPPNSFPVSVGPGVYLVGVDIQPGLYAGQGDRCYWARLSDLSGQLSGIIANDNASGQFYIQVDPSDMGLETKCPVSLVR